MERDVFIIDAVRTPVGRRNGGLSTVHPGDLLGLVQRELISRTGIDPGAVGQIVGGCVSQVGTANAARHSRRPAWPPPWWAQASSTSPSAAASRS
jgi:acetyl-CoA C-acetyltransferase